MARNVKKSKKNKPKNEKGEASSSNGAVAVDEVWQPGVDAIEDGEEELVFDPKAYNFLWRFCIGWPCLSFDIVQDKLGCVRPEFPHTVYCIAGTQADKASRNYIGIFKISNIVGKNRKPIPPSVLGDDDNDMEIGSSSDEDDGEEDDNEPVLHLKKAAHPGCINRIRSMTQQPNICATWGDTGHVQVWDVSSFLDSLAETRAATQKVDDIIHNHIPIKIFSGHKDEGYAIDWSPYLAGRLVSGDCNKCIHLWEPTSGDWNVDTDPFVGHAASVEDLQWHPNNGNIFASCSADGTVAVWDVGSGKRPCISVEAHNTDVNVITWNSHDSHLIASGCDDGSYSIHDVRYTRQAWHHVKYHRRPITSIEWSLHERGTLAVSSDDNQQTFWKVKVKTAAEKEAEFKNKMKEQINSPEDIPPQLRFVHMGQKHIKELHWHRQIPGMIISTAADCFNVLMPSNI